MHWILRKIRWVNIYIIKEGDGVENILKNYNVSRELLEEYNDLNDLKIGDKIIIPVDE